MDREHKMREGRSLAERESKQRKGVRGEGWREYKERRKE